MEAINFIWVGPPKFETEGGHDVIGPISIAEDFKKFSNNSEYSEINFFCLRNYRAKYNNYFKKEEKLKKIVNINVVSIEDYIDSMITYNNEEQLNWVKQQDKTFDWLTLVGKVKMACKILTGKDRSRTPDYVFFKDLFSFFIMTTKGGYFLDTNIYASEKNIASRFIKQAQVRFPWVTDNNTAEVWFQYAPKGSIRALYTLYKYIEGEYDKIQTIFDKREDGEHYSKSYHASIGHGAATAIRLNSTKEHPFNKNCIYITSNENGKCLLKELGITKEYYNSHTYFSQNRGFYNKIQQAAYNGDYIGLQSLLKYGAPIASFKGRAIGSTMGLPYDAEDENLLHIVTRTIEWRLEQYKAYFECIKFLVGAGVPINDKYLITFNPPDFEERTALSNIIHIRYMPPLEFLLHQKDIDLLQIINNETILMLCIKKGFESAFELLLEKGSQPNQRWHEQKNTPLGLAIELKKYTFMQMLLNHSADPFILVDGKTPLDIAKSSKDETAINILLTSSLISSKANHFLKEMIDILNEHDLKKIENILNIQEIKQLLDLESEINATPKSYISISDEILDIKSILRSLKEVNEQLNEEYKNLKAIKQPESDYEFNEISLKLSLLNNILQKPKSEQDIEYITAVKLERFEDALRIGIYKNKRDLVIELIDFFKSCNYSYFINESKFFELINSSHYYPNYEKKNMMLDLIKSSGIFDIKNNTPYLSLHQAVISKEKEHIKIANKILENDVDITLKDLHLKTPLDVAIENNNFLMVKNLLQYAMKKNINYELLASKKTLGTETFNTAVKSILHSEKINNKSTGLTFFKNYLENELPRIKIRAPFSIYTMKDKSF